MLEIGQVILRLTHSSSEIAFHPLPADDPKVRRPDISLVKMLLKWEPKVELEEALGKTIRYFQRVLSQAVSTTDKVLHT